MSNPRPFKLMPPSDRLGHLCYSGGEGTAWSPTLRLVPHSTEVSAGTSGFSENLNSLPHFISGQTEAQGRQKFSTEITEPAAELEPEPEELVCLWTHWNWVPSKPSSSASFIPLNPKPYSFSFSPQDRGVSKNREDWNLAWFCKALPHTKAFALFFICRERFPPLRPSGVPRGRFKQLLIRELRKCRIREKAVKKH